MEEKQSKFSDLEKMLEFDPSGLISKYKDSVQRHRNDSHSRMISLIYAKALYKVHRYAEAKDHCLESIKNAISIKDYPGLIKNYLLLAMCFSHTGEPFRIKACFDIAMDYARQIADADILALVCFDYGAYLIQCQSFEQANSYLETALKTLYNSSNKQLRISTLLALGDLNYRKQNYKGALSVITQAYELSLEGNDIVSQVQILDQLATLYDLTNKPDTATQMLDKAMTLCQDIPPLRFKIIYNYGTHLLRQGKGAEALQYFLETDKAAIAANYGMEQFLCELNNNIAGCYWNMHQVEKTREYLEIALGHAQKIDNQDFLMQTKLNQTHFMIQMGDYERAEEIINEAIGYYQQTKNKQQEIAAIRGLAYLYEYKGDFKKALEITRRNERNFQAQIATLRAEMSTESESKMASLNKKYESGLYSYQCISKQQKGSESCVFIGSSAASRKVLESALLAAQHPNANVFIFGESGTGKDVLANIIHYNSIRRDSPFVAINVSSLSAGVLESELFGHVRGAFTGAVSNTKGFLHKANKGTLFLDEITEMHPDLQAKLLRVVETLRFSQVGSSEELAFDSRIIGTTNRDIYDAISSNSFRLDLFHRLNIIEIYIPPLRERKDDIEELLMHYTELYAQQNKLSIPKISDDFVKRLKRYHFPGNVRELRNLVERLYILCGNEYWTVEDLTNINVVDNPRPKNTKGWDDPEVERIITALEQTKGKQKDAAKILHLSESTLCRRIAQYNLEAYTLRHRTH